MSDGFQRVLDHIRFYCGNRICKGKFFERLMKTYFREDPLYNDRFSNVWLWSEWTATRPDFDAIDTGIDLVAEERDGGYCAIQCKCYAPGTRLSKPQLDSFISTSAREPFTARIVVDTGDEWGAERQKGHRGHKAGLRGTALRRPSKPPAQLARLNAPVAGRSVPASRAIQLAASPAGCV